MLEPAPIATRCCSFVLDPRGFVRATMTAGAQMDLADAQEAIAATGRVFGGGRGPVLVDSRGLKSQTRAARDHFVSEEAAKVSSAVALLVESPVSRMIGNFFLRQNAHRTPTRLFTLESAAIEWLLTFLR